MTIQTWEENLKTYLNTLNQELLKDEEAKKLYYGFDVIDGKLIGNPEILFVGINPGKGSGEQHYEVKFSSDRMSYLDHYDNEYNYPLANETISLLKLAGLTDTQIISKFETQCVKTNLYHIITTSDKQISQCTNRTKLKFGDFYKNSIQFCVQLIQILKPKIVIFEGKSVYYEIIDGCYEVPNTWDKDLQFGHYYSDSENIHFIGYSRLYSNIIAKENIAAKIKSIGLD